VSGATTLKKLAVIMGRLGLVLAGLLVPLIFLEFAVRLLNLAPPPIPNPNIWEADPILGWQHVPNSGGTFYSGFNEYETDVQINSLGLRDDLSLTDYDLPEDQFKLLILADSFGEALQVPLEQTFFKQLQALLTEAGQPTQSINAGVGSWGNDQELLYYQLEGRKFRPDLTLLFFYTANDTVNNSAPLEIARNGGSIQKSFYQLDADGKLIPPEPFDPENAYNETYPKPAPLPPAPLTKTADWLWLHSDLYRWFVPYLGDIPPLVKALGPSGILGGESRIRATHPAIPVPFYVYQTPMSETWIQGWDLTEAILAELQRQVEGDGGQLAVIIIPAREQVYPQKWEQTLAANQAMQSLEWDLDLPNKKLTEILTRQEITYLDLLPTLREQGAQPETPPLHFTHDGHWTEAGHRLAAETIFQFLQTEDLVTQVKN
jgi:hypothetical protein